MACSTPQAIAMSARVAPSTVAHVLRLVGSSYLDAAGPSSSRTAVHRRRPLKLVPSRRFASTATAPARNSKPQLQHDSGFDLASRQPRRPLAPIERTPPPWATLPDAAVQALLDHPLDASAFARRFDQTTNDPCKLLSIDLLINVAELWSVDHTSRADWMWLLKKLNAIREAEPLWTEVPDCESVWRILRGTALAVVEEDYTTARANVAVGIKAALNAAPSETYFSDEDLFVVQQYIDLCRKRGRIEDVCVAIRFAGYKLHRRLVMVSGTLRIGYRMSRLRDMLLSALAELPEPLEWLQKEELVRGSDGARSRALDHLSIVVLAALAHDKSRAVDGFHAWRTLGQHHRHVALPPSIESLLAVNLAEAGHLPAARLIFDGLHAKHKQLPHKSLTREMRAYATHGLLEETQEVWKKLLVRHKPQPMDLINYATAYAMRGDVEGAESTLKALVGGEYLTDIESLVVLQRACIKASDADGAAHYLDLAKKLTPTPPVYMYERLLNYYAAQASVNDAVSLFESMIADGLSPSLKAYTSLISVFGNHGDHTNANFVFEAMLASGHDADAPAWSALLNASIEGGEWLLAAEQCERIPPELLKVSDLATTVLKAYVLVRAPSDVIMSVFRRINNPDENAWSLAVQAAADDSNQVLARTLFERMDAQATENPLLPKPGVFIYSSLLAMYLRAGDRDSSRAVYDTMIYRNILPTSVTYGIITTSYANSPGESSVEQAHNFAMSVYNRTVATELRHARADASENVFSPLLVASGRNSDLDRAKKYYDLIQSTGGASITLNTKLMDAYRRTGQVKPMYRLWLRLFRNAVSTIPRLPNVDGANRQQNNVLCVPLSITLQAFAEAGLHQRIKNLWTSVRVEGFGFDSHNYNHMAQALATTGDVMGAFHIVDRVLIPRHDEVKDRYHQAFREGRTLLPVDLKTPVDDPSFELPVGDEPGQRQVVLSSTDVAERGPRVSNRRHEVTLPKQSLPRRDHDEFEHNDEYSEQHADENPRTSSRTRDNLELDILRFWRPSDILWRPSASTMQILAQAYDQIEEQSNTTQRTWGIGLTAGESEDAEDLDEAEAAAANMPVMTLPEFNNVTVKNEDGSAKRLSPRALLMRINRRYGRAVALVGLYRRRQSGRRNRDDHHDDDDLRL